VDADPLAEFLKLAQQEGALEGENLEAFLTGLRERANRVIAERLGRAETKLTVLESENQWQRDAVAALEGEKAWLRETLGALEGEKAWLRETTDILEGENARLRETIGTLEAQAIQRRGEIENAGEERRKASAAHESLLTHHRELMARLVAQIGEIAALSPLRAHEVRRRLRALADLLRAETL
jgi:predicted nuclease with TOPRIM domain